MLLLAAAGFFIGRTIKTASKEQTNHSIAVEGHDRSYTLYVPKIATSNAPLVVMLHGALGTSDQAIRAYDWNQQAAENGFIVAYPQGLNRSWAVSESCCGPPVKDGVNDVEFIRQMVADIKKQHQVDDRRVYAAGISNGGALAYRLACDTDIFAAIGVVAANLLGDCPSPAPLSVIHIHGTADQTFPYQGGPGRRNNDGQGDRPADTRGPAIPNLIDTWRKVDGCGAPSVNTSGPVTTSVAVCTGARTVELITIEDAGHQWPGAQQNDARAAQLLNLDPPSPALNATDVLWDFFDIHSKN